MFFFSFQEEANYTENVSQPLTNTNITQYKATLYHVFPLSPLFFYSTPVSC